MPNNLPSTNIFCFIIIYNNVTNFKLQLNENRILVVLSNNHNKKEETKQMLSWKWLKIFFLIYTKRIIQVWHIEAFI